MYCILFVCILYSLFGKVADYMNFFLISCLLFIDFMQDLKWYFGAWPTHFAVGAVIQPRLVRWNVKAIKENEQVWHRCCVATYCNI